MALYDMNNLSVSNSKVEKNPIKLKAYLFRGHFYEFVLCYQIRY